LRKAQYFPPVECFERASSFAIMSGLVILSLFEAEYDFFRVLVSSLTVRLLIGVGFFKISSVMPTQDLSYSATVLPLGRGVPMV